MKEINELKEEYSKYERKIDYVKTLEDFLAFITVSIDDLEEQQVDIIKEMKLNCKDQLSARIRNFFLSMFQIEEVDYYTEDNGILDEILTHITTYISYYHQLQMVANEENFQELTKLVDFLTDYYNEQNAYFESERDALEFKLKGFSFFDSRNQDNREVINDFFNHKLNEYTGEKAVEKQKKMC